jgi:Flp pilus assembly protein TadD
MRIPALQAIRIRRPWDIFSALLLLPLLTATAYAQLSDGPGLGDSGVRGANNIIQGNLFYPSGRRFDRKLQVRISSVRGLDFSTLSDENGSFSFRRLPGGTYYVTVDAGKEYLPVNETVNIVETFRTTSSQTYAVQIQLQLKSTSEGKPGVLNAGFAGVPKAALELYEKARKAAQSGDNKKAIEALKEAIAVHPQFTLAYNELGVQYFKQGNLADAGDALNEAINLSPEAFSPRLNNAIVLFYKKQYQSAGEELDHAIKINDTSAIAHLFRGRVFVKTDNFAKAEPEFLRAISLGGGDEINEAHRFLAGIYNEQGNYPLALKELETYLKASPKVKDAEQIRKIIQELRSKAATSKR